MFGLSAVIGGPPDYERRISSGWSAFHAQGARLTSKCLSVGIQLERRLRQVSPASAGGSWGWLWTDTTRSRVDATTSRAIRNMMGLHANPQGYTILGRSQT